MAVMMGWKVIFALACCLIVTAIAMADEHSHAHMESDPMLARLMIDKFELRDVESENPVRWEIEGWLGRDLRKLWLKSEGRYVDGATEAAELQLLYDQAITPYWDVQAGWRADLEPEPQRDWFALGMQGVTPYFIGIDAALFLGDGGRSALRFKAEYEWRLTHRLILIPDLEANAYGEDDPERGIGSGLSEVSIGFRLHYLVVRQFGPYVGIEGRRKFGATEDYARAGNGQTDNAWLLAGMRAWF
jgi:copper resistance protein B